MAATVTADNRPGFDWVSAGVVFALLPLTVGIVYWLGYKGVEIFSWTALVLLGFAVIFVVGQLLALHLAFVPKDADPDPDADDSLNHPVWAIIVADVVMAVAVGATFLFASSIGWSAALITIAMLAVWATFVVFAGVHLRRQ